MKKHSGIIVVEGKTDKDFIESFIDAEIVTTNGSDVPCETLNYLIEASKNRSIIILTDPDFPGSKIRQKILDAIPNAKQAFMRKEDCIKRHKVGVAESNKEAVLEALDHLLEVKEDRTSDLTPNDLYELGLLGQPDSKEKRIKVMEAFHLGYGSSKVLLKRAKALGLNKVDLERVLYGRD